MAGFDVGISGAVLCVTWLGFHSWLRGDFWWAKFNVAGGLFFGGNVYSMGFGRATLAGIAVLIALYASVGVAFGLLARTRGFARNLLLGLVVALLWHILADRFVWRRFDPFALAYYPSLATLPAHLLLAINFSRFSARFGSLALTFGSPGWSQQYIEVPEPEPEDPSFASPAEPEPLSEPASQTEPPSAEEAPVPADPGSAAPTSPPPTLAVLLLGPASEASEGTPPTPDPPAPSAASAPSETEAAPPPSVTDDSHLQKGSVPPIVD
jgi:hypothetical protein